MGNMIISMLILALALIISILGVKLAMWVGIPVQEILCAAVISIMLFPIFRGAAPTVK
jgi:hypothetical protein